jgi:hypothetical protein
VVSLVPQDFKGEGWGTKALGTHGTGDWMGCRADVELVMKGKNLGPAVLKVLTVMLMKIRVFWVVTSC